MSGKFLPAEATTYLSVLASNVVWRLLGCSASRGSADVNPVMLTPSVTHGLYPDLHQTLQIHPIAVCRGYGISA